MPRNGREVYRGQFKGGTNSFRLLGDPENRTVAIKLQQATVTMTFTDEPMEPEQESPPVDPADGDP